MNSEDKELLKSNGYDNGEYMNKYKRQKIM